MRFALAVFVALLAAAAVSAEEGVFDAKQVSSMFTKFITNFKKSYSSTSLVGKMNIFKANLERIARHNAAAKKKGTVQYVVNNFADMSAEEFKAKYLTLQPPSKRSLLETEFARAETEAEEEAIGSMLETAVEEEALAAGDDKATAAEKKRKAKEEAAAKKKAEKEAAAKKKAEEKAYKKMSPAERAAFDKKKADEAKAEKDRIAAEQKAERERIAAEQKAERERIAKEQAEARRIAEEKATAEELAALEASPVDWRTKNVLMPIKNQGGCGSCWAYAAIATIEAAAAKLSGSAPVGLSEQHFVDCSPDDKGCNGGYYSRTYAYAKTGGVYTEASWPYTARQQPTCNTEGKTKAPVTITDYKYVSAGTKALMKTMTTVPAIAMAVDAGKLQFFGKGVYGYNASDCPNRISHAVVGVGYGSVSDGAGGKIPVFHIRNSWGKSWGQDGYFSLYRPPNNAAVPCGADTNSFYPIVA